MSIQWWKDRTISDRTAIFLVTVNIILVFVTAMLVVVTEKLVSGADETARRQLRAYAYVNTGPAFHVDGQGTLQVYSMLGNSGQTPAINVERFVGIEVLNNEIDIADALMEREPGITVLGPQEKLAIVKNWKYVLLDEAKSASIRNGELKIYVFGRILFVDIFGARWETRFCNAYYGGEGFNNLQPTKDKPQNTSFGYVGWQARPCENGNGIRNVLQ